MITKTAVTKYKQMASYLANRNPDQYYRMMRGLKENGTLKPYGAYIDGMQTAMNNIYGRDTAYRPSAARGRTNYERIAPYDNYRQYNRDLLASRRLANNIPYQRSTRTRNLNKLYGEFGLDDAIARNIGRNPSYGPAMSSSDMHRAIRSRDLSDYLRYGDIQDALAARYMRNRRGVGGSNNGGFPSLY